MGGVKKQLLLTAHKESKEHHPYQFETDKLLGTCRYGKPYRKHQKQGSVVEDQLKPLQTSLEQEDGNREQLIRNYGRTIDNLPMIHLARQIEKENPYLLNARTAMLIGAYTVDWGKTKKENIPKKDKSMFSQERYQFFLDAPFEISNMCCNVMKKSPVKAYQNQTGRMPMTAQMASESRLRTQNWLKAGCNGFDLKHPISNPMAFWTEQDVLLYIWQNKIPICSVYGEVVTEDQISGQMNFADLGLFELERPLLTTTGCNRTGCMFCGFGCHLEKPGEGRFERMKETHPRLYEYVFADGITVYTVKDKNGYEIKVRERYLNKLSRWVEQNRDNTNFIITEKYIPDVGLGYKHIIDWINEHGNLNIKY